MTILDQCKKYNNDGEYQKTIDLLSDMEEKEITADLHSELAYVLINIANGDLKMYKEALALHLLPFSNEMQNNHSWNYRVAYCYMKLEKEAYALDYFKLALKALPGDYDTMKMIEKCTEIVALPRFDNNFRVKVRKAWKSFGENEEALLSALKNNDTTLFANTYRKIFTPIWPRHYYKILSDGDKYTIELSIERLETNIFILDYIKKQMPHELQARWNISIGIARSKKKEKIRYKDIEWSLDDFSFHFDKNIPGYIHISSNKAQIDDNDDFAYMIMDQILVQSFGEIESIQCAKSYDFIVDKDEKLQPLSTLIESYESKFTKIEHDVDQYFKRYEYNYTSEPEENLTRLRDDIVAGLSMYDDMIESYNVDETYLFNDMYSTGIVPGFFAIPSENLSDDSPVQSGIDLLTEMESYITNRIGNDFYTTTGKAFGIAYFYLEIIAFDLPPVIAAARDFLKEKGIKDSLFQVFRADANVVPLY